MQRQESGRTLFGKEEKKTLILVFLQRMTERRTCMRVTLMHFRRSIAKHIVDRIIHFGILNGDWEQDERFSGCYRPIIKALLAVMDGHLL